MTIFTTGSLITAAGAQQLESSFAGASAPATPVTGQLWYDIPNAVLKVYTGSSWAQVSGSSVTVSESPPVGAVAGSLWFNVGDTVARLFVWTGTVWVDTNPSGGGSGGGGVTSITAGTGISVSGSTGAVTITATGFVNTAGAVGSVMRVTRADGAVFSYNTTTAGSNLRRLGVVIANASFLNLNTSISGTVNIPSIGDLTTYPVPTFDILQVNQSLSGTWLSLGTIGTVVFSYTDAGVYGYLSAYQSIHLAVRIA